MKLHYSYSIYNNLNILLVNEIKKILYQEYSIFLEDFSEQIIDILILEGKKKLGDQVKSGILPFVDFITTDNYFLTTFDLWLLIKKFEIPTIFISTTKLLETNNKDHFFIGYGKENDDFFCLAFLRNFDANNC